MGLMFKEFLGDKCINSQSATKKLRATICCSKGSPIDIVGFGYAAFLTIGSTLGYKGRGGVLSLIASFSVGLLAGDGVYRVSNDKQDIIVSLFTTFFLATIMSVRFKKSEKIIPADLVASLSIMMIQRLVLLLL
ncbi:transmembrane protein 14A-like [Meriones unguiculatus]|uniref:transmembrane protein 14A-like n=1 Tax=Meriones unguiculatus TaxID=10047 RepID=UPI00293E640E|nr:transmembrane protein 14A-like [Meriones unguiculatus]